MAAAAHHRQPRAGRPAEGRFGIRPADRARRARRLAAGAVGARWPTTQRSASSRSTGESGRSAAYSRPPRARGGPGSSGSSAQPSRRPRPRWRRSSRYRYGTSPRPRRTSAASGEPTAVRARRRGRKRWRRATRTLPTFAARSARDVRSSSPPPAGTTSCSPARREPARRCSRAGSPGSFRRSSRTRRSRSPVSTRSPGCSRPIGPLIRHPPFRAPHHSASMAAIVGGGPDRAARRGQPRPSRSASPRRAPRVHTACARGAPPAARGRFRRRRRERREGPSIRPGSSSSRR